MKRKVFKPFSKKTLFSLFVAFTVAAFSGCSSDDDEPASPDSPDNKVTINADGTASGGAVFHRIDDKTFFLDYIKYEIVDSHLEVCGYDETMPSYKPKLYSEVRINGAPLYLRKVLLDWTPIISITIPSTVTYTSLTRCKSLKNVVFPKDSQTSSVYFWACTSLTNINLPDGLRTIEWGGFRECTSLNSIKIPDNVTEIESYAFEDCTSLTSIELPYNLNKLGDHFINHCKNLKSVTFKNDVPKQMSSDAFSQNAPSLFPNDLTKYVPNRYLENYKSAIGGNIIGY